MEAYGHVAHSALVERAGLTVVPVAVDGAGAQVTALSDEDAVVLTPSHQFPTGVALSPDRRADVVVWARDTGALIVEDDYDGEFRYDRRPVGALQGLAPDVVAYAGTVSKSLAPGVGLGWLVLPPSWMSAVAEQRRLTDGYTGVLEQMTLSRFLTQGHYDRHVRRSRLAYRRRRDTLLGSLQPSSFTASGIAAGLHLLVRSNRGAVEPEAIRERAAHRAVRLRMLQEFCRIDPSVESSLGDALVIGYGRMGDAAFLEGVRRFARSVD